MRNSLACLASLRSRDVVRPRSIAWNDNIAFPYDRHTIAPPLRNVTVIDPCDNVASGIFGPGLAFAGGSGDAILKSDAVIRNGIPGIHGLNYDDIGTNVNVYVYASPSVRFNPAKQPFRGKTFGSSRFESIRVALIPTNRPPWPATQRLGR
jgi:hypothetical protein